MDVNSALQRAEALRNRGILDPQEEFEYIEALEYLIKTTDDPGFMVELGSYYYGIKEFEKAKQYYEMADELGEPWAPEGLGYIWYYGRTGEKDYEKAFKYYSKAAANGFPRSKMKVADMYRNGYYVEKDYEKYCDMIEKLYLEAHSIGKGFSSADISVRLSKIRAEQGNTTEAIDLLLEARLQVARRLSIDMFFGDLSVMKGIEEDLEKLMLPDRSEFDLYDLFILLKEPRKVSFQSGYGIHLVESAEDGSGIIFDGKKFDSIEDFFLRAEIEGFTLPELYETLGAFRIES